MSKMEIVYDQTSHRMDLYDVWVYGPDGTQLFVARDGVFERAQPYELNDGPTFRRVPGWLVHMLRKGALTRLDQGAS